MTTTWHHIKRVFRTLTPEYMAETELLEARLQLLESQSALEHAQAMVAYNTSRVERLTAYTEEKT